MAAVISVRFAALHVGYDRVAGKQKKERVSPECQTQDLLLRTADVFDIDSDLVTWTWDLRLVTCTRYFHMPVIYQAFGPPVV